jgi:hypothetical protein
MGRVSTESWQQKQQRYLAVFSQQHLRNLPASKLLPTACWKRAWFATSQVCKYSKEKKEDSNPRPCTSGKNLYITNFIVWNGEMFGKRISFCKL